jgi:general secretion pathway protein G
MMKQSSRRSAGFTLIEVLLVIAILLVLGTVSVVGYTKIRTKANKDAATILVRSTVDAFKRYQIQMGNVPDTETGFQGLITKPEDEKEAESWAGPYLDPPKVPVDPWRNELKYEYFGESEDTSRPAFRVWSLGPDKQDGTEDDISSWTEESGT